ncbi:MAG: cytochrome P450 [Pseudomonadota bacterium]
MSTPTMEAIYNDPQALLRMTETPEGKRDPHPLFNRLREIAPIYHDPLSGLHFLFRWDDCNKVLRSNRFGQGNRLEQDPRYAGSDALQFINRNLAFKDAPDHTRLRNFAQKAFTRPVVERMRGYLEKLTQSVLDELESKTEIDVVADYSARIPGTVICEMLGIPRADHERFDAWVADQFRLLSPMPTPDDVLREVDASTRELIKYLGELIEARRAAPQDDLISNFLAVKDESGQTMSNAELIPMCSVLLGGGSDTTKFVIAMAIRALVAHPEQARKMRGDPGLQGKAFEEFLRFYGPVTMGNLRVSFDDIDLGGYPIKAGEAVVPVLLAANFDPGAFPEPNQLDVARHPNLHLAFGGGAHACLGMMLARLVGPYAIDAFNRRVPNVEVLDERLDINEQLFALRGLRSMRVRRV